MTPTEIARRAEKALATTRLRSASLEADGYRIEPQGDQPGIYAIRRPRADRDGVDVYEVDLFNETCSCPQHFYHGDCKHRIAAEVAVLNAIRLAAPLIPVLARHPVQIREQ